MYRITTEIADIFVDEDRLPRVGYHSYNVMDESQPHHHNEETDEPVHRRSLFGDWIEDFEQCVQRSAQDLSTFILLADVWRPVLSIKRV